MLTLLKLAFGLLFGLFTFILPLPLGGEQLLGEWGRAAMFFGIVCGVMLSFAKAGRGRWPGSGVIAHKGALIVAGVLAVLATGLHLYLLRTVGAPQGASLWLEVGTYAFATFLDAVLLSLLGAWAAAQFHRLRSE